MEDQDPVDRTSPQGNQLLLIAGLAVAALVISALAIAFFRTPPAEPISATAVTSQPVKIQPVTRATTRPRKLRCHGWPVFVWNTQLSA